MRLLFLLLFLLPGCSRSLLPNQVTPLPIIERIDTKEFVGIRFPDSTTALFIQHHIEQVMPNEVAFCFYGHAKDTVITMINTFTKENRQRASKIAIIDSVTVARIKSATPYSLTYVDEIACLPSRNLIGVSHTHPLTPKNGRCNHSNTDALYLQRFGLHFWFSLVVCPSGSSILWQDGRRRMH